MLSCPGRTELLGHGAQVMRGWEEAQAPALSLPWEPGGSRWGSRSVRAEWGRERAPGPEGPALKADGPRFSTQELSVIQRSRARIFERGLSLKTLKEKQHPKGRDITKLGLLDKITVVKPRRCHPGPLPPAKPGTFPQAHPLAMPARSPSLCTLVLPLPRPPVPQFLAPLTRQGGQSSQ